MSNKIILPLAVSALLILAATVLAEPAILVTPESLEFGDVKQNQTLSRELTITNTGDEPLRLHEVRADCGCTTTKLTVDSLNPGESTVLTVTFSSKKFEGPQYKLVHIQSDDPLRRSVDVSIAADVKVPLYTRGPLGVRKTIPFSTVRRGDTKVQEMLIWTEDLDVLDLSATVSVPEAFTVEFADSDVPNRKRMLVTLQETASAKVYHEFIHVRSNHPDQPKMDVEITARVVADLYTDRSEIKFRYVKRNQELRNRVRVRSQTQGLEWKVTKVEFDLPDFTAEIEEMIPNTETFVRISGRPVGTSHELAVASKGRIKGIMKIHTDLESMPVLEVSISYLLRM